MDLKEMDSFSQEEERRHWWIKTRFLHIDRAFKYIKKEDNLRLIEFGCGSAQNLWYLKKQSPYKNKITNLTGHDPELSSSFKTDWDSKDIILTNKKPEDITDMALAMDVLEHIEDEDEALQLWKNNITPNGILFLTVPAFNSLWSYHDEYLGHKRRYTKKSLIEVMKKNGFEPVEVSYAFSFIFPLVYIIRKVMTAKKDNQDLRLPPSFINTILYLLGKMEKICGGFPFFGTSVVGIFRRI